MVLNVTSVTVTYWRGPDGEWVADPTVVTDAHPVDAADIGSVFTANVDGHPPWLVEFIDAVRPTIGTGS